MSMSTMTLIDDYVAALLDDGDLAEGRQHDRLHDDGIHQDRMRGDAPVPAPVPAPVTAAAPTASAAPSPAPVLPFVPSFVPAFVPGAPIAAATPAAVAAAIEPVAAPAPALASSATAHRWLRVTVGDDSYGLELLRVQEVVRLAPIVALRGAARAVLGVMNLRGRIVPVLDLGLWLQAGCVHGDERSRIVVVERDDEMIGVLVSAVEDVVTLGRERIEPPLASSDPGAIVGIARVGAAPTVLLDATALLG